MLNSINAVKLVIDRFRRGARLACSDANSTEIKSDVTCRHAPIEKWCHSCRLHKILAENQMTIYLYTAVGLRLSLS